MDESGDEKKPYIFAVQREFNKDSVDLKEVNEMRARITEHERKGTVPEDVLAWAGLGATSSGVTG